MSGEFPTQLGDDFTKYVAKIISNLGIVGDNETEITKQMESLNNASKFKIINDTKLRAHLEALETADKQLHALVNNGGELHNFYNGVSGNKEAWDESMKQIAILQGLIILRKISQNDCDGLIKNLLKSFDTKLKAVNELLSSDLKADKDGKQTTSPDQNTTSPVKDTTLEGQNGGSDYLVKYLKYKNKYLKLLKNNM
jgi:hypothetical protein